MKNIPKENPEKKGTLSLNKILTFSFVPLIVLGVLVGSFVYLMTRDVSTPLPIAEEETVLSFGTLLFTGITDGMPAIYSLNLDEEGATLQKFDTPNAFAFVEFTDKFDAAKLYFNASSKYTADEADQTGLHSWDLDTNTFTYYKGATGNIERDLNFSQITGQLAFVRLKSSVKSDIKIPRIDDYEIVILDPEEDSVVAVIEGGLYPRWSPSENVLLYLRTDGLYEFSVETKQSYKVLGPNESDVLLTPSTMIAISPEGSHVVLTSQGSGSITIFNVESWNPATLLLTETVADDSKFYTAPVISPEGTMYAVLTTDKNGDVFTNPRLEIRGMHGPDILFSYPLDTFDPQKFFIDDWVARGIVFVEEE